MTFLAIIWSAAVFCGGTPAGYAGWTSYPARSIMLEPHVCTAAAAVARPALELRGAELEAEAEAVYLLAHEEGHAHDPAFGDYPLCSKPGTCEDYADCYAAAHAYELARTLGASGYNGRRIRAYIHAHRFTISRYSPIPQRCFL